ncbi:MAG: c-type cytochrome [Nitrospirae bacterium YQR-1]
MSNFSKVMFTAVIVTFTLVIMTTVFASAQEKNSDGHQKNGAHNHVKYQKLKNPVKPTAKALEEGKLLYAAHCATCHGSSGNGDGETMKGADFTTGNFRHGGTDGEVYNLILHGSKAAGMPAWNTTLTSRDIWKLVRIVKSYGK